MNWFSDDELQRLKNLQKNQIHQYESDSKINIIVPKSWLETHKEQIENIDEKLITFSDEFDSNSFNLIIDKPFDTLYDFWYKNTALSLVIANHIDYRIRSGFFEDAMTYVSYDNNLQEFEGINQLYFKNLPYSDEELRNSIISKVVENDNIKNVLFLLQQEDKTMKQTSQWINSTSMTDNKKTYEEIWLNDYALLFSALRMNINGTKMLGLSNKEQWSINELYYWCKLNQMLYENVIKQQNNSAKTISIENDKKDDFINEYLSEFNQTDKPKNQYKDENDYIIINKEENKQSVADLIQQNKKARTR